MSEINLFGKLKTSFQKLTLAVGLVGKGVGSKLLTYVLQVRAAGNWLVFGSSPPPEEFSREVEPSFGSLDFPLGSGIHGHASSSDKVLR